MKLKISFPGKLLPIGKDKYIVNDMPLQPSSSGNTEPDNPNAGLYIVGGIILVMVLMLLFWPSASHAQDKPTTGLEIGDQVPDITINNIMNYKGPDGKPATSAKISDFKGKLLILDFWATWCSPCVAMIPKMESLQKEFAGKVQFLPVAYQSEKEVNLFLQKLSHYKKTKSLPGVVDDKNLAKLFPHTTFPHYVWIDQRGIVKAFSSYNEISAVSINNILNQNDVLFKQKTDESPPVYDTARLLFSGDNGGKEVAILYHETLSGYAPGLKAMWTVFPADSIEGQRITATNLSLLSLYELAYRNKGIFRNGNVILDVKDTILLTTNKRGQPARDWMKKYAFCYEIKVPYSMAGKTYLFIQQDLQRMFAAYNASVEQRDAECYVLIRTTNNDKIKSVTTKSAATFNAMGFKVVNYPLKRLIDQLGIFLQASGLPVIDLTGYKEWVDLDINADMTNVNDINQELMRYDLRIEKRIEKINHLIIKDNIPVNAK